MNNKLTVTLALAAGLLGGFASHYFVPARVYAQGLAVPQEIRAHKFVLVDETGVPRGAFGIEINGVPEIEVSTPKDQGYRMWGYQATDWGHMHGFTGPQVKGPDKPTLLPAKP
jgi:hypothetical protein